MATERTNNHDHSDDQPKGLLTRRQVLLLLLLIGIMAYLVMLLQEFAPIRNIAEVTRGSRFSSTVNDSIAIDSSGVSMKKRMGNDEDDVHVDVKFELEIFEENWPRFKQKLCPDDIPAHMKYGVYKIFFLSMDHMLFLTNSTFSQKLSQPKIITHSSFISLFTSFVSAIYLT
mmetsp:Transcript_11158/g.22944  ORF Transcript_11158/g.22944 Transcript_11158/m.22944 type:complete len:172 (+) Transcript_11158:101-616(+)